MKIFIALAVVLLISAMLAGVVSVAQAQPAACGSHVDVIKKLKTSYKEQPAALGLAANGSLIEVLTSAGGKTWTLIMSRADGLTCIMASGHSWENVDSKLSLGPET